MFEGLTKFLGKIYMYKSVREPRTVLEFTHVTRYSHFTARPLYNTLTCLHVGGGWATASQWLAASHLNPALEENSLQ